MVRVGSYTDLDRPITCTRGVQEGDSRKMPIILFIDRFAP